MKEKINHEGKIGYEMFKKIGDRKKTKEANFGKWVVLHRNRNRIENAKLKT